MDLGFLPYKAFGVLFWIHKLSFIFRGFICSVPPPVMNCCKTISWLLLHKDFIRTEFKWSSENVAAEMMQINWVLCVSSHFLSLCCLLGGLCVVSSLARLNCQSNYQWKFCRLHTMSLSYIDFWCRIFIDNAVVVALFYLAGACFLLDHFTLRFRNWYVTKLLNLRLMNLFS